MSQLGKRPDNKGLLNSHWHIFYHPLVVKNDIPKLPKREASRIKKAIENKIAVNPIFYGIPLRATLKQYWKIRVGDYRIVYAITGGEVRILIICHRREVYKMAERRK